MPQEMATRRLNITQIGSAFTVQNEKGATIGEITQSVGSILIFKGVPNRTIETDTRATLTQELAGMYEAQVSWK